MQKPWIVEKLVAVEEFANSLEKFAVRVLKANDTVTHLHCIESFFLTACHFLAHGGKVSAKF